MLFKIQNIKLSIQNYLFILVLFTINFSLFTTYSFAQGMTVEQYIHKYKDLAIKEMKIYGIPASITLAQGIEESSNGNSLLARVANNHFGIKCQDNWNGETIRKDDNEKDECFRKYKTAEESFRDHSEFIKNRTRYSFLFTLKSNDYEGWARGLKTAGYATNPKYPELLINSIQKYKLYDYDSDIDVAKSEERRGKIEIFKSDNRITSNAREVIMKNDIKAVYAKRGDNYASLAKEMDLFEWQILKYNDLKKEDSIHENDIIYLQPKRRKGSALYHVYKYGESLRDISQLYGIKLKHLLRKNRMEEGSVPVPGQKLFLQGKIKAKKAPEGFQFKSEN